MLVVALLSLGALAPAGAQAGRTAARAPVLLVHGKRLSWTAAGTRPPYRLLIDAPEDRSTITVHGRAAAPTAVEGATVGYRVRAASDGAWSNRVSISYPIEQVPDEPFKPATQMQVVGLPGGSFAESSQGGVVSAVLQGAAALVQGDEAAGEAPPREEGPGTPPTQEGVSEPPPGESGKPPPPEESTKPEEVTKPKEVTKPEEVTKPGEKKGPAKPPKKEGGGKPTEKKEPVKPPEVVTPPEVVEPPAQEESTQPPPSPSGMVVGLDAGGWGPSAFGDIAGATHSVRLESRFATESEVGGAAAAGVTVATWIFGTGGSIGSINPTAYAAEIVSVFKKYGKGGTFWKGKTDLGGQAVEVLNEPGGKWFWSDPTNYAAYVKLLKTVHETLASNFPEAIRPKVLASWDGGLGPNSTFGTSWAALGGLAYCDGVTVHPYGGTSGQDGGALGGHRDVEAAHDLTGKPVYVTEVGWPTATGKPATGDSQQWTEAQQAENVTNFVDWARGTGYVDMVVVFNYVDYGSNNWYGIERSDRSHKPSFEALARVSF